MTKRPDFDTSRVKKKRHLMMSVRSLSDDHDESTCQSGAFNLDSYNSRYEQLRLNHI